MNTILNEKNTFALNYNIHKTLYIFKYLILKTKLNNFMHFKIKLVIFHFL